MVLYDNLTVINGLFQELVSEKAEAMSILA